MYVLQVVGRGWWLPVPVCSHAGKTVKELDPSGSAARVAEPAEGLDCHAALNARGQRSEWNNWKADGGHPGRIFWQCGNDPSIL